MSKKIGKKFGRIFVDSLHSVEDRVKPSGGTYKAYKFNCTCDCGNVCIKNLSSLTTESSCGCLRVESNKSRSLNLEGQIFTFLKVLKSNSKDHTCECRCGCIITVKTASLRNGNTKSCGCMQKEKASNSLKMKHQNLRLSRGLPSEKPLSSDKKIERTSFTDKAKEIKKRDKYTCSICNKIGGKLVTHHIVPWEEDSSLRYENGNLITLCKPCHLDAHNGDFTNEVNKEIQEYLLFKAWAARVPVTPNEM